MRFLSIKNFQKHQHYRDRRPPWIKLHVEILDDYAFSCLQDASKAHLMLLWVLASKLDNRIPYDLGFLTKKLGATSRLDLEELVLQGFIEISADDGKALAARKQSAMPETEAETERETDTTSRLRAPKGMTEDERQVIASYLECHPRRRVSDKTLRRVVRPALKQFTVHELQQAILGNASDPWHVERRKHDLGYVLRDADKISEFMAKAEPAEPELVGVGGDEASVIAALGLAR